MTFKEYINNPTQSTVMNAAREMYRNMYIQKYDALMVREKGNIEYHLFSGKNKYYIYAKIPSETVSNFYYDVVIEFTTNSITKSLLDCEFRVFSNDPSFVFTFAYAFNKNKLFLTELESRMGKRPLKEKADEKNPKNEIGYVKTIYFTYLVMKQKGLFLPLRYGTAPSIDFKALAAQITSAEEKIESRQKEGEALRKKKKTVANAAAQKKPQDIINPVNLIGNIRNTGFVKKIGGISGVKKTKKF